MTGRIIPPGDPEFVALFDSFETEAFQLETLQTYGAAGEDADLAAFLSSEPGPPVDEHDAWLSMVRRNTAAGRAMRRVHIVTEPLTPYMRYELCWPYAVVSAAGEDIRILDRGDLPGGTADRLRGVRDSWLFDYRRLYRQHHDPEGRWLGTELVDDGYALDRARLTRDWAWAAATPWADYVAARPDLAPYIAAVA